MDRRTRRVLLERLRRDADVICARFGLRYASIQAERANVKRRYGICYADGTIKIRLRNVATGRPLKYSSLVSTLCHELAHLRHFDHSPRFYDFYHEILRWCRGQGIYRPTPRRRPALAPQRVLGLAGAAPARRPAPGEGRGVEPARAAGGPAGPVQLTLF